MPSCALASSRSPAARAVGKGQRPAMFFNDLLDDSQPKPRPPLARRYVRLGNALALVRQADAVVGDRNLDTRCLTGYVYGYRAARLAMRADRLDGVLDEIRHRLPELTAVANQGQSRIRRIDLERDLRVRDFVKENRRAANVDQRFLMEDGLGHAREG